MLTYTDDYHTYIVKCQGLAFGYQSVLYRCVNSTDEIIYYLLILGLYLGTINWRIRSSYCPKISAGLSGVMVSPLDCQLQGREFDPHKDHHINFTNTFYFRG